MVTVMLGEMGVYCPTSPNEPFDGLDAKNRQPDFDK